jgi:rubrerythrin
MDVASRRIATALKTAIRREERTADAYQVQAKKARDPGAKKVLESLVRQEMEHAKKLKLVLDKGIDSSILGKRGKHLVEGLHVVNDDVRDVEKGGEVARVLTRAMKAEQNSSALYRSLEKIYKGVDIEELFGKLAEEEDLHKARLERMLARL